jgi:hypothetical protein
MAHKCTSPGCAFYLPDKYPLGKCPWHAAPGSGPVKIAAAIAIAAAGLGGGIAYKKFREYLRERKLHPTHAKQAKRPATKKAKRKSKRPARKNAAPNQSLDEKHASAPTSA